MKKAYASHYICSNIFTTYIGPTISKMVSVVTISQSNFLHFSTEKYYMKFLIKSKTDFKNVDDVLIRIIVEYQKRFSRSIGVDGKTTIVKWNDKSATYIGKILPNYLAREILDDTWIDEIDNNIWQITQN